jgi:3-isopropylmalate/(R)-2-methylmalate dehydratase small subunit
MPNPFTWQLRGRCYKLGHNVPHADGVIPARFITARETDPTVLVPHLFEETDPGFSTRCQPGDIIVTGKNFGMGPKGCGYIAMQALGLGLLCESMSAQAHREAVGVGLRVLSPCHDLLQLCESGDDLEVDFRSGRFHNHTRHIERIFSPIPQALQDIVRLGGNFGWLANWHAQPSSTHAP